MEVLNWIAGAIGWTVLAALSSCFLLIVVGMAALLLWAWRNGKIRRIPEGFEIEIEHAEFRFPKK